MPIVPKRMAALIAAIATFTPTSPSRAAEPEGEAQYRVHPRR